MGAADHHRTGPVLDGWFRDRGRRAGRDGWQRNLICFGALDLLGRLLCDESLDGLTWCAFGTGDPAWDQQAPPADRNRRTLTAEVARVRIAGDSIRYVPSRRTVRLTVTLPAGVGAGPLREFGLFGGDASARPGSGLLVNHRSHPPVDHADDDTVTREVHLVLDDTLPPGARDLFADLLARGRRAEGGLGHVAFGTSGAQVGAGRNALGAEVARVAVDRQRLAYDRSTHRVVAVGTLAAGHRAPGLREAGLFGGGSAQPGGGALVDRVLLAGVSTTSRAPLEQRFVLRLGGAGRRPVPDVVGRDLADATEQLGAGDLGVGTVTMRDVASGTVGQVLEQLPPAGTELDAAASVDLVVGRRPRVVVPAVVGVAVEHARGALAGVGLEVDESSVERPDVAPGLVVVVAPPAGTTVDRGTRVALTVADVAHEVVPDVRGRSPEVAAVLLRGAGFTAVDTSATAESTSAFGTVVDQAPAPGERAAVDTTVSLTLAVPFTAEVPDLAGVAEQDVADVLAAAASGVLVRLGLPTEPPGLSRGTRTAVPIVRPDDAVGIVVTQRPAAGARIELYSTVDVGIAAATDRKVPDVVGRTQAAATSDLAAAGFGVGAVEPRASVATVGTVVEQRPVAGATWPAGARITLVLAVGSRVVVPRVIGLAADAGREAITSRGLAVGAVTPQVGPERPGTITAQSPAAETVARIGAEVALTIAAGVPAVVGLERAEAIAAIEAAGLAADVVDAESASPAGTVLGQDPVAGSPVAPGGRVTITVAVPVAVEVPDVVGTSFARAETTLGRVGLRAQLAGRREDSTQPEGAVLGQEPAAGSRVGTGAVVALVIAVAPQRRAVPDLAGLGLPDARKVCADSGFDLAIGGERAVAGAPAGTVVGQEPAAGVDAVLGETVTVVVAAADTTLEVPDVRGLVLARAVEVGRSTGFAVEVSDRVSGPDADVVVDQDPAPPTRVPVGTTIRVIVTTAGTRMPNVVGMNVQTATTGLQRLNLAVDVSERFVLGRVSGIVLSQDPAAGTSVTAGATVSLVVSSTRRIPFPGHGEILDPDDRVVVLPPRPRPDEVVDPVRPIDPSIFTRPVTGPVIGPIIDPGRFLRDPE